MTPMDPIEVGTYLQWVHSRKPKTKNRNILPDVGSTSQP
jgi:hypothetical protein